MLQSLNLTELTSCLTCGLCTRVVKGELFPLTTATSALWMTEQFLRIYPWLVVGIPVQEDGTPNSCQMFAEPQYHLLLNSSSTTELPTVPCQNGWVYDNNNFKSTLATEWDLVCDKRIMNRATASIFFLGVMFGATAFGYLSDRFGTMLTTVFGFASAFSYNFTLFAVMRFLTGFGISGVNIIAIVL
ncbi:solute carrier family 22 member 7-like isoform X1 [Pseudochaenichthys georgianus]|uniref:solute carrier family 22 member 7-like isoform X1 n=1 Tax=Pseudochaenichthys georgianus TaxID=52239 RepID=UPI0039C05F40